MASMAACFDGHVVKHQATDRFDFERIMEVRILNSQSEAFREGPKVEASSCLGERAAWNAGKIAKEQAEGNSPTEAKQEVVHLPRQTFANGGYLLLLKQLVSATPVAPAVGTLNAKNAKMWLDGRGSDVVVDLQESALHGIDCLFQCVHLCSPFFVDWFCIILLCSLHCHSNECQSSKFSIRVSGGGYLDRI